MMDKEGAIRACKDTNPIIDGRKANVNLAYLGAKQRPNGNGYYQNGTIPNHVNVNSNYNQGKKIHMLLTNNVLICRM